MQNVEVKTRETEGVISQICDKEMCLEKRVYILLKEIGIPAHIKGYYYIKEGILLSFNNNGVLPMTKILYPSIARKFDTTPSRVERAIRHAIEICWLRGNPELMDEIFGYTLSYNKGKATNSEFFASICNFMISE